MQAIDPRIPRPAMLAGAAAALLLLVGCAAKPALQGDRTTIDAAAYEPTFNAAVTTLRDYGFRVDRQDYRYGIVTTLPRTSPIIAEVWDGSNTTGYQALESTFNNQRRVVQVMLEPIAAAGPDGDPPAGSADGQAATVPDTAAPGVSNEPDAEPKAVDASTLAQALPPSGPNAQYLLRIEAVIERYENPQHHLSGSTRGHRTLSSLRSTPDELRARGIAGPYWYAVRRDPYLEEKLLNAIVAAAAKPEAPIEAAPE